MNRQRVLGVLTRETDTHTFFRRWHAAGLVRAAEASAECGKSAWKVVSFR